MAIGRGNNLEQVKQFFDWLNKLEKPRPTKKNNFVLYNSTFRNGLTLGHIVDITWCMISHVIPNGYRGLVIGIGLPDPPQFFPEKDLKRAERDPGYASTYDSIKTRLPKPEDFRSYFTRMYELELVLRGQVRLAAEIDGALRRGHVDFQTLPFDKVFIVPKFPHVIYPQHYDIGFNRNYQGRFEPPKSKIAKQYIVVREGEDEDGRANDRIKRKLTEERNIGVAGTSEKSMPKSIRRIRGKPALLPEQQKEIAERIRGAEFELGFMFNSELHLGQKELVDETIRSARKKGREVVFAVPYSPLPVTWEEFPSPFNRYAELKDYLFKLFSNNRSELDSIYVTFVEMEKYKPALSEKPLSYLPPKFTPHYCDFLPLPDFSTSELEAMGLDALIDF